MADFEVVDAPANFKSKVWQYFGFARVTDQNGIKTVDKTKTVCKVCEAQLDRLRNRQHHKHVHSSSEKTS